MRGEQIHFLTGNGKNINFTRVVVILALLGHQTSHSQNTFFFFLVADNSIFSTSGSENGFVCPARGNKIYFLTPSGKKNRVRHEKNINSTRVVATLALFHTRKKHFFPLVAQYTITSNAQRQNLIQLRFERNLK